MSANAVSTPTTPRPVVQIIGPWLKNNGDQLNLWAIAQWLGRRAELAVSDTLGAEELPEQPVLGRITWRIDRSAAGRAVRSRSSGRVMALAADTLAASLAPSGRRARRRSLVPGRRIAALVDCSGYAYGDTWGIERVRSRTQYFRKLRRQGCKIIMLPQAFGPFLDPAKRGACQALLDTCDLVFARDEQSLEHLRQLGVQVRIAGPAPDITHGVQGVRPADADAWQRRVAIVPNARMLDRTARGVDRRYVSLLHLSVESAREQDLDPVLLLHEANDRGLAERIASEARVRLPIVADDALRTKGMIAHSYAVIGSRYHALLSALASGVPAIGTSWSHKYEALFQDYDCSGCLLDLDADQASLRTQIQAILNPTARATMHDNLVRHTAVHQGRLAELHQQVEAAVFGERFLDAGASNGMLRGVG